MNIIAHKTQIVGALVVAGSTSLAAMYSSMPSALAVPVNTLIMGIVGVFIRWVEKKILKEKSTKQVPAEFPVPEIPVTAK